jgi:hypothetical protein
MPGSVASGTLCSYFISMHVMRWNTRRPDSRASSFVNTMTVTRLTLPVIWKASRTGIVLCRKRNLTKETRFLSLKSNFKSLGETNSWIVNHDYIYRQYLLSSNTCYMFRLFHKAIISTGLYKGTCFLSYFHACAWWWLYGKAENTSHVLDNKIYCQKIYLWFTMRLFILSSMFNFSHDF